MKFYQLHSTAKLNFLLIGKLLIFLQKHKVIILNICGFFKNLTKTKIVKITNL